MALTRAEAEGILIQRCGKMLAAAGLDGTTVDGTNASLTDPLGVALRHLGFSPAGLVTVTTSDLSGISASNVVEFFDVANLAAMRNALNNWTEPDQVAGQDNRQDLGKLRTDLRATVEVEEARLADLYNYGVALGIAAGTLIYGFQTREE